MKVTVIHSLQSHLFNIIVSTYDLQDVNSEIKFRPADISERISVITTKTTAASRARILICKDSYHPTSDISQVQTFQVVENPL